MKKRNWLAIAGLALALFGNAGCAVSDVVKTGRETLSWTGETLWDGTKYVYAETKYGLGADRPEQFDPEDEEYYNGNFLVGYTIEKSAKPIIAEAIDLALERTGEQKLTREQMHFILWHLDGEDKDRKIDEEDARLGYDVVNNLAGQTADNPFGQLMKPKKEGVSAGSEPPPSRLRSSRDPFKKN